MKRSLLGVVLAAVVLAGGCVSPYRDRRLAYLAVPPDFALELHVAGPPAAGDGAAALAPTAHYVVQPNRRLHVARGPAAAVRTFPPMLRVLTHPEYESLYRVVEQHGLMRQADPAADEPQPPGPRLEAAITAGGRTQHYATTPEQSPGTAALLDRLGQLQETLGPLSR